MSNPLVEISLDLAEQLEAALIKEASMQEELAKLQKENSDLSAKINQSALEKKASEKFDARLLSATTALENAGFFSPGTAVTAYQALSNNPGEIPVLLEKLAAALTDNFSEGSNFSESLTKQSSAEGKPENPWVALLQ